MFLNQNSNLTTFLHPKYTTTHANPYSWEPNKGFIVIQNPKIIIIFKK